MIRIPFLACALLLVLGCDNLMDRDDKGLYTDGGPVGEEEQAEVEARIADLAAAADLDDPDAEARYNDAVHELTLRGSSIEPLLVEALAGSQDWAIRYGVIHVLDGVGTRSCIEPLIAVLDDPHYLVAYKAVHTLRVLCEHREIPADAGTADPDGLPPVPPPDRDDLDIDAALKPWITWHDRHGPALRDAWSEWWAVAGGDRTIE